MVLVPDAGTVMDCASVVKDNRRAGICCCMATGGVVTACKS